MFPAPIGRLAGNDDTARSHVGTLDSVRTRLSGVQELSCLETWREALRTGCAMRARAASTAAVGLTTVAAPE